VANEKFSLSAITTVYLYLKATQMSKGFDPALGEKQAMKMFWRDV